MDANVIRICGVTPTQVAALTKNGVSNTEDLSGLTFSDLSTLLPTTGVVVKRRIANVANYIAGGGLVDGTTTMAEVMMIITQRGVPVVNMAAAQPVLQPAPIPFAAGDPTRGAPRIQVNGIGKFSGEPMDWETWERDTSASIGQTVYSDLTCRDHR